MVFFSALATSQGFSWNFFFGSDYMGKTFVVQRDPQEGYRHRDTNTGGDQSRQNLKIIPENFKINKNVKLSKYLRISY